MDSPTLEHQNVKFHFGKRKSWKIVGWFPDEYHLPPPASPAQPSPHGPHMIGNVLVWVWVGTTMQSSCHRRVLASTENCTGTTFKISVYAEFSRLHLAHIKPKNGQNSLFTISIPLMFFCIFMTKNEIER